MGDDNKFTKIDEAKFSIINSMHCKLYPANGYSIKYNNIFKVPCGDKNVLDDD